MQTNLTIPMINPALRHKWRSESEIFGMKMTTEIEFFDGNIAEEKYFLDSELVMHIKSKVAIV